jgi:hypothetical protein
MALRAQIKADQGSREGLQKDQEADAKKKGDLAAVLGNEDLPGALKEARAMVHAFYQEEEKKWQNSEYSKEDVQKYFTEEHLASLSVNDYALLLKRFSGKMVAHVTRQGIRDHNGMVYHNAGMDEYVDGFMRMVQDGRLRSPLGIRLIETEKEKALQKYLHLERLKTKKEAIASLDAIVSDMPDFFNGKYSDKIAVHFATEEVADCLYGSERGNEIFIAYPSEYIASQYYLNGQLTERSGGQHNDQWVWANEERGMDLNAGLIFIPKDAKVDRKTGSRYELDENKKPKINQQYMELCHAFVASPDFFEFADRALKILGKMHEGDRSEELNKLEEELKNKFGITDPRLQKALLDYQELFPLTIYKREEMKTGHEDPMHTTDSEIREMMRSQGVLYIEAKDAISSKDFWENYFKEHPDKRPSKIVYYEGQDPTEALIHWREERDIGKEVKDEHLGFPEHFVSSESPEAKSGIDRFYSLANKAIEDYYEDKQ